MKRSIEGYVYNRIEKLGEKDYQHLGFEDDNKEFSKMLESFVPEIGMKRRVKITFEEIEDNGN